MSKYVRKRKILIVMCLYSHAQLCQCSSSDQNQLGALASFAFDQLPAGLFAGDNLQYSNPFNTTPDNYWVTGDLNAYRNRAYLPVYNLTNKGTFIFPRLVQLWDSQGRKLREASFRLSFTMGIYRPSDDQVRPAASIDFSIVSSGISVRPPAPTCFGPNATQVRNISDASIVTITIGRADALENYPPNSIVRIGISIQPLDMSTWTNSYTVWIDYDHFWKRLSVYVDVAAPGISKPHSSLAINGTTVALSDVLTSYSASSNYGTTMGQLLELQKWNSTVDALPIEANGRKEAIIILSVVLGSLVPILVSSMAAVYYYLNSKYRRWKDFDQLAKSMQHLLDMPIQFSFTDIQKATNNFHEAMKLGQGGCGAVYRCRLPTPTKGEVWDVAVKKFTRDDNRHYHDFLAEVSIISHLHHKNIVPLIVHT